MPPCCRDVSFKRVPPRRERSLCTYAACSACALAWSLSLSLSWVVRVLAVAAAARLLAQRHLELGALLH
eukprot:2267827-Pleurochrysis_carterae.AAC.3